MEYSAEKPLYDEIRGSRNADHELVLARPAKQVRVTVHGIRNARTGDDPGNELEIFGWLGTRGVWVDASGPHAGYAEDSLWKRFSQFPENIPLTHTLTIGFPSSSQIFLIFEGDFLWIGGHLKEHDDVTAHDDMGERWDKIHYPNIVNGAIRVVRFRESNQIVDVTFTIEMFGIVTF